MLNCVDVLAGDDRSSPCARSGPSIAPCSRSKTQTKNFVEELQRQTKAAEDAAKDKLDQAQKAFDKQVDQVKARTDLDDRTKEIMLANLQEVAQRRLEVEKAKIEDEKLNRIREGKADSEQKTRAIENRVRFMAAVIPPLPPLILGPVVFGTRVRPREPGGQPQAAGVNDRAVRNRKRRQDRSGPERATASSWPTGLISEDQRMNELSKTLVFSRRGAGTLRRGLRQHQGPLGP